MHRSFWIFIIPEYIVKIYILNMILTVAVVVVLFIIVYLLACLLLLQSVQCVLHTPRMFYFLYRIFLITINLFICILYA